MQLILTLVCGDGEGVLADFQDCIRNATRIAPDRRAEIAVVLHLSNNSRTIDANHQHVESTIIEEHMVALMDVGSEV